MRAQRIASIDQFRGLAILLMAAANFAAGVERVPAWLKHAPDIGLTVVDLIAPMFIFAIGLTYGPSFRRRLERDGNTKSYAHFAGRYLAILGAGALISAGETALGLNAKGVDWGVLQAIGAAGLLTLLVIRLPAPARAGCGLLLLAGYQFLMDRFWLEPVLGAPHGGLLGSLAWAAMLILATALGDVFHQSGRSGRFTLNGRFILFSLLTLAAGCGLAFFSPISKNRVSSAYVLVSLGLSPLIFLVFHLAGPRLGRAARWLSAWGANPLGLYFLHYLLIGLVVLPGVPWLHAQAPLWLAGLELALVLAGLSAAALWLERREVILTL
jgi:predicted acyltransferase